MGANRAALTRERYLVVLDSLGLPGECPVQIGPGTYVIVAHSIQNQKGLLKYYFKRPRICEPNF